MNFPSYPLLAQQYALASHSHNPPRVMCYHLAFSGCIPHLWDILHDSLPFLSVTVFPCTAPVALMLSHDKPSVLYTGTLFGAVTYYPHRSVTTDICGIPAGNPRAVDISWPVNNSLASTAP